MSEPAWIPVSEQMPEEGKTVLMGCANHGWVAIGHRVFVGKCLCWEDGDGEDLNEPTHWRPVPDPPQWH